MHSADPLPPLAALGPELCATTPVRRWLTLVRPFFYVLAFAGLWRAGLAWLSPAVVFLLFVAVVTSTHDVVHRSLGLSHRATELWLFALGALLLASGHSYRRSHLRHHAVFPGEGDPEGDPARMTWQRAVLHGPMFLFRLWAWSWLRAMPRERAWLAAEAAWVVVFGAAGIALRTHTYALLAYAVMVQVGTWVFPLLTVHLPHKNYGTTPLTQTHTLRGRIIPRLFLELTYHLEHHLFPQVPSHHLAELSRRLTPTFEREGVVPWRVL